MSLLRSNAPAELDALYHEVQASGETRVVVYSSTVDTEFEPLWLEFQKDYPQLRVVYMMVTASQIMSRMAAERATGNHMGDVLIQPVDVLPELKKGSYLTAYVPPTIGGLDERLRDPQGYMHYGLYKLYGVAYNTRLIHSDDVPRRLQDVLEPRWREQFSYVQPLGPVGNTDAALATLWRDSRVTRDDLDQLRQAGNYAFPEAGISYVAQGRQSLNLWAYLPPLARQHELGAPVAISFPAELSTLVPYGIAVTAQTPHANAARLLTAWLFSERGQRALAERSYMLGTQPGAPVPRFFPNDLLQNPTFHMTSPPDELLEQMKRLRPVFADVFLAPKRA
ncbi:ABC transporter substrate-binding protein [Pseudomonas sp. LRF_L74]|uniref:ABC transporter substrate-binding protein n=1 Tax=Pseudomonas sp. LRF_L74 TaxID=3369422 RepID=UPI003F621447